MGSKRNKEKEGVIGSESISIANKLWNKYKRREGIDREFEENNTEEVLDTFKDELEKKLKGTGLEVKIVTDEEFDRIINGEQEGATIEIPKLETRIKSAAEIKSYLAALMTDIPAEDVEYMDISTKIIIKKKVGK